MRKAHHFQSKILSLQLIFEISLMEHPKEQPFTELKTIASGNIAKYNQYLSNAFWQQNGKADGEKMCLMYKMGDGSRVASMGVVNDVEGTLEEFAQMLRDQQIFSLLDPQMIEFKELCNVIKSPNETINVNYTRFKGISPTQDRDFILVEKYYWTESKFYVISSSCNYPFPEVKNVVRGQVIIAGYLAEKIDQKSLRVIYLSEVDLKGNIPDSFKDFVSQSQGKVVSRVNGCLKKLRHENQK